MLEAQGSVLTNKYAEGYPGQALVRRLRAGRQGRALAIDRAKRLFGAEHANVQPHSGSQANFAVYASVLQPGDKILAMNLSHGGHLTHGNPANFSGKLYQVVAYGVREDNHLIDYDELAEVALREKPKMITVGASAYSRMIDFARMGEIARACRRAASSPTSPTSPAWSPRASIPRPCPTPTSSPPRRTRRCAAPAAA